MKYLILIYRNPQSREIWENMSPAEQAAGYDAYAAFTEELMATGELIVSEALADPSLSKRVTVRGGRAVPTDGPFAEAKEQLAGIFLVECDSIDRAVQIAARMPGAEHLDVDVRPVLHLAETEP
ncbi:MAG TPA: YciI family protein [Micromonosporaceae bacterium]